MEQSLLPAATLDAAMHVTPLALNLTLLTDGEALSLGAPPDTAGLAQLPACGAVIESLVPEIRQLAMLFAARRYRLDGAAAQLSDGADWMAARIVLLQLSSLRLPLSGLPLLDRANARIRALGDELGVSLLPATLQAERLQHAGVLQAVSRLPLLQDGGHGDAFAQTALLRTTLRLRLHHVLFRLGLD